MAATLTPTTTRMLRELYRRRIRLERNERLAREAAPRSRFAYAAAATKQRSKVRQLERQLREYGIDPDPRPTTTQEDTSMAASTTPTTELHPALTTPLPSAVDPGYTEAKNRQLRARLAYAREQGRGYVTCYLGGAKVHAAVSEMRGHSGHLHPRALCQPHTPRSYAGEYDPVGDEREVTCQRCLASLGKRGLGTGQPVATVPPVSGGCELADEAPAAERWTVMNAAGLTMVREDLFTEDEARAYVAANPTTPAGTRQHAVPERVAREAQAVYSRLGAEAEAELLARREQATRELLKQVPPPSHPNPRGPHDRSLTREQARQYLTAKLARTEDGYGTVADAEWRLRWLDCAPEGAWHCVAPLQDKRGVPCGEATREQVGDGLALRQARAKRGRHQHSGAELSLGEAAAQLARMGLPVASGGCDPEPELVATAEGSWPVGTELRRYYAVPTHYTIGTEYSSYAEAEAAARATIKPHQGIPGYTRAWVDTRVVLVTEHGTSDQVLERTEVHRIDGEPLQVGEPVCGMNGWGCPELHRRGDYLSDGYPSQAEARWAAERALQLMLHQGMTLEDATTAVGEQYTSSRLVWGVTADDPTVAEVVGTYEGTDEDVVHYQRPDGEYTSAPADVVQVSTGEGRSGRVGVYEARELDSAGEPEPGPAVGDGARAYQQGTGEAPSCSCEWRDGGDGESGPSPYISQVDEGCEVHGRAANPEQWAEEDRLERGYVMSGVCSLLRGQQLDPSDAEDLVLGMYEHALQAIEAERGGDDGHNGDRAIGRVADALRVLYTGEVGK